MTAAPQRSPPAPVEEAPVSPRRVAVAALVDTGFVVAFVVVGRRSHEEGLTLSGVVSTAAPFVLALAGGWVFAKAWRRPFDPIVGQRVLVVLLVGGLVVRRVVFGDGIAPAFIVVTTLMLGAALVGWRYAATKREQGEAPKRSGGGELGR